jgi:Xaa-Pro dipeptidase
MARKRVQRLTPPLFPEHPLEEHRWRLQRARKVMAEMGLDALLLGRNVNVFYMTGSRFVFVGMDAPTALAPQSTAIITQDADVYCQRFGPFDSDEVGLHTTCSESMEFYDNELELVNIMQDYEIGKGARIGTEWGSGTCVGINPIKFMELQSRVNTELGAEFVDGTTAIAKYMVVKSPLEVGRMKVAVNAAARAMNRIYDVIQIGMNELEVKQMANQFMLEEGAESLSHAQVMAEGEEGLSLLSCDALDRKIEKGWVHLDMGCKYKRYGSDINRGLFLGREPTKDEEKLFYCRSGANDVLDRTIKPGVSIDDAITAVKNFLEGCGCVLKDMGGYPFLGHTLGLEPYQPPNLVPSIAQSAFQNAEGKVIFEPGMLFTYEMVVDLPGSNVTAFFNMEDDVVVTETGVENMNGILSREIRVK